MEFFQFIQLLSFMAVFVYVNLYACLLFISFLGL